LDGLREAAADVVVVMDADLSHPVDKIPELVEALRGKDKVFVVGSRYVKGGKFDRGWSFLRFLNAWIAARMALHLTAIPLRSIAAGELCSSAASKARTT